MLSTTTFLLSKTFLLSQFSPPSAAHNIADTHLPLCDPTWLSFIKILPPLCSPCFQLHSFYKKHSFYHNFPPPLQPMLSTTTFLLSKTFLLSQFTPPSAAHAFNYNIPFIKNITFITIFPPLYSPQHSRHTFAFVRPYLTSFYQNFPPPLQPMLSTTTFLLSKTFLLAQFSPPSAAHNIADTHLPLCDPTWLPFIKIFSPLCNPCFQLQHSFFKKHSFYRNFLPLCSPQHSRHKFAFVRPYLTSFYQNFPPLCSPCFQLHSFYQKHSFYHNPTPLQPMLSTTTFLLSKTFFLSKFSPPLQPMLSTTFLLSKTFLLSQFSPPPSAAHAFNYNIPFIKNITFITISPPSAEASKLLHLPHKSHLTLPNKHV